MSHVNDFITQFINRYDYPAEAKSEILRLEKRLDDDEDFGASFDRVVHDYQSVETIDIHAALKQVKSFSDRYNENRYTMYLVFLLNCAPILKEKYKSAGIDEAIYFDTMDDLRCKLNECIKCKEVPGIFVPDWFDGFFKLKRFTYGRFQYEVNTYDGAAFTTSCGRGFTTGDTYINLHIPSSGPSLTDEVRLASYRLAYGHYQSLFPDGNVIFGCSSWLLYPGHREFLPAHLNILRFMEDFELVSWREDDSFSERWRVFDKYADLPDEQLPRDTSLRRAYADRLCSGGKTGEGFGIFVFDGNRIVR